MFLKMYFFCKFLNAADPEQNWAGTDPNKTQTTLYWASNYFSLNCRNVHIAAITVTIHLLPQPPPPPVYPPPYPPTQIFHRRRISHRDYHHRQPLQISSPFFLFLQQPPSATTATPQDLIFLPDKIRIAYRGGLFLNHGQTKNQKT